MVATVLEPEVARDDRLDVVGSGHRAGLAEAPQPEAEAHDATGLATSGGVRESPLGPESAAEAIATPEPMTQRRVLGLALPIIGENLLQTLVGAVDTFMVARLGAAAVAGVGMGFELVFFIISILSAIDIGATVLVSQAIGAGDQERANHLARQAIVWGLILAVPVSLGMFFAAPTIIGLFGAEADVAAAATEYLQVIAATSRGALPLLRLRGGAARGRRQPHPAGGGGAGQHRQRRRRLRADLRALRAAGAGRGRQRLRRRRRARGRRRLHAVRHGQWAEGDLPQGVVGVDAPLPLRPAIADPGRPRGHGAGALGRRFHDLARRGGPRWDRGAGGAADHLHRIVAGVPAGLRLLDRLHRPRRAEHRGADPGRRADGVAHRAALGAGLDGDRRRARLPPRPSGWWASFRPIRW